MAREAKNDATDKIVLRPSRRPSLRALAAKSGVSHTIVARALRNDTRVSEPLRKKLQALARREGYIPSDITSTLITGKSMAVGVVMPTLLSSFVSRLVNGMVQAIWEAQLMPFVLCSGFDLETEEHMLERLAIKRADGVVIMPTREDRGPMHFAKLIEQHTPIVAINNPLPTLDIPLVASDDEQGARQVTRHLIEQGHQNILHVGVALDSVQADRRREIGYRAVMEEAGLQPRIIYAPQRLSSGQEMLDLLETYFASPQARQTSAIFCFNDTLAYSVYTYADRAGLKVGDLAVVGFGNLRSTHLQRPDSADIIRPSLSTVEQFPETIARVAIDILQRMMVGKSVERKTLTETKLLVRESSGSKIIS